MLLGKGLVATDNYIDQGSYNIFKLLIIGSGIAISLFGVPIFYKIGKHHQIQLVVSILFDLFYQFLEQVSLIF
jgi:hypothetical protein